MDEWLGGWVNHGHWHAREVITERERTDSPAPAREHRSIYTVFGNHNLSLSNLIELTKLSYLRPLSLPDCTGPTNLDVVTAAYLSQTTSLVKTISTNKPNGSLFLVLLLSSLSFSNDPPTFDQNKVNPSECVLCVREFAVLSSDLKEKIYFFKVLSKSVENCHHTQRYKPVDISFKCKVDIPLKNGCLH